MSFLNLLDSLSNVVLGLLLIAGIIIGIISGIRHNMPTHLVIASLCLISGVFGALSGGDYNELTKFPILFANLIFACHIIYRHLTKPLPNQKADC